MNIFGIATPEPEPERTKLTLYEDLRCIHCRGWHLRFCPRVKRIAFAMGGAAGMVPAEVEFWGLDEFDDSATIYEDDERYEIEVLTTRG